MDYFLVPLSETEAVKVPFPFDLPLEDRADYMADPPAAVFDAAERVSLAPLFTPSED